MYWPFITTKPSQSEIFSDHCELDHMYWPFRTTTPSQSEIFSVIVALLSVLAFQDQTPSQSKIFFVIVA